MDEIGRATLRDAARLVEACMREDDAAEAEVLNRSEDPDYAWQVAEHAAEVAATWLLVHAGGDVEHAAEHLREYTARVMLSGDVPGENESGGST